MKEILELEQRGWKALSSAGDAAVEFYRDLLLKDACMVFPGRIILQGKENILESLDAQPWKSFRIETPRVHRFTDTAVLLTYRVTAHREGSDPYEALISSMYIARDGAWKMAYHQHTMV